MISSTANSASKLSFSSHTLTQLNSTLQHSQMSLVVDAVLMYITLLFTLTASPATSLYSSPSPPAAPFSTSPDAPLPSSSPEWLSAHATYYTAADPRDTVYGACGYGDLLKQGHGLATVSLSEALFNRGQICGACFELRCVDEEAMFDRRWCIPGNSIVVTATNFCAPNYGFDADSGGGHCNPPKQHFVLPIEAFEKIAIWKAGNMPVQYRRIKCRRDGGIRFMITGSGIFISVLISNVGGSGDIVAVKLKGSRTGWLPMGRNWGQNWHLNALLQNQPLSFEVTSSDGITVTSYNVAPKDWSFGQSFEGKYLSFDAIRSFCLIGCFPGNSFINQGDVGVNQSEEEGGEDSLILCHLATHLITLKSSLFAFKG